MGCVKTKEGVIEKALKNRVISENISTKLDLEEIIYLNRIKHILNYFSIESTLQHFINRAEVNDDYQLYLKAASDKEVESKKNIDRILNEAIESIPTLIRDFISVFLANVLYNDYKSIDEKYEKIINSQECTDYIKKLENALHFENPYTKNNVIYYVKRKYATPVEYYYIDLINNLTHSEIFGLLYILYE